MTYFPNVLLYDAAGNVLVGQKAMAASLPVVIASDQASIPVAASLGTGTNSVGDVRSITTSIIPGVGATHLGKAEDAVAASSDTGVAVWTVRSDTPAAMGAAGDYAPFIVDALNRQWINGQIAHDSPISGAPVRVGGRAQSADMTAVATGDQVDALFDLLGKQVFLEDALKELWRDGTTAAITGTSDTAVIAAPGAGLFLNIRWVAITNSHATVSTVVELKSATTVRVRQYAVAAGGGLVIVFKTPLRLATNEAFNAANVTTGSNTYVSAGGFVSN